MDWAKERAGVTHLLHVRDKPAFLPRLMEIFAGGHMSLEGDLARCVFPADIVLTYDELGVLRRNTIAPRQDFVVLRLEKETVAPIFRQLMAAGLKRAILHVQIEREGVLQLGAYDNFHPECVVTGPGLSATLLAELQSSGILRNYQAAVVNRESTSTSTPPLIGEHQT
jgi:hypothetical protein